MISATVNISGSFLDTVTAEHVEAIQKCSLASSEILSGGQVVAATCCIGAGDHNVKITALDGTSTYTLLMWQAD